MLIPPARWKTALVSAVGIMPLLKLVGYCVAPQRGDAAADPGSPHVPVPGTGPASHRKVVMSNSAASLQGMAALVTGAATGIGKAIAAALAAAGARVVVNHNHTPNPPTR